MEVHRYVQVAFVVITSAVIVMFAIDYLKKDTSESIHGISETIEVLSVSTGISSTKRLISTETIAQLPIQNIVPTTKVKHSIPLNEIRQGCSRQDCIPSVDAPEFISITKATGYVVDDQIGIALSYNGENRFYPFSMLVTHELVNDIVAGDPLLVTYCPLCGTGIVFERTINTTVYEFGVSGMLWQSNLLMYNRDSSLSNRNLWSQVLGEAVVGKNTGVQLIQVPSDIMKFGKWSDQYLDGQVLDTGSQRDPYNGAYFQTAQRFAPDFNQTTSPLTPDTYVYGIEVHGIFKAYPRDLLHDGEFRDMITGNEISVTNNAGKVTFRSSNGKIITDVEGFWFSWFAVHPDTLIWNN